MSKEEEMIAFIKQLSKRLGDTDLNQDTPLISSGMLDSLHLVGVLIKLEELMQVSIPPGRCKPRDLDTVRLMFQTGARMGKPRT